MTITYQFDVSTATFCGFAKLLAKWRGSIYKLVYKEMVVYAMGYACISMAYRLAMNDYQKRVFEKISLYCERYLDLIPLSFVLGFYVTFVVQRWWQQFTTIPWPDRVMNTVTMYVHGTDERGRLIRRTLMRYINLSFVLVLRSISLSVKKRFPTFDHLVEAGFLTSEEIHLINRVNAKINKYWIPMSWFINLVEQARKEGRIQEGSAIKHIVEELNQFRSKTSLLWCYDWVTVPIVYTQVVTWATHIFFIVCLIGRQYLDPSQAYHHHDIDMYVPFFTLLQFFFYVGWLKVAEQLINPFGEDEDDFETNWLVDRNLQVSYLGVDELYGKLPQMEKDIYWDDSQPDLPYTQNTLIHKIPSYCGSTMHLRIPTQKVPMVHQGKSTSGNDSSEMRKSRGYLSRFWKTISPKSRGRSGMKLWKKVGAMTTSTTSLGRRDSPERQRTRTLGRRESLLGGEFLAMLNRGRHKRGSDASQHSPILTKMNGLIPTDSHVINIEVSPPESPQGPILFGSLGSRRGSLFRRESSDSCSSLDKDKEENVKKTNNNAHIDNHLLLAPKPYKSVFGEGHQRLLARLSEIENENETDGSVMGSPGSSPFSSPYATVVNPEIGKKLMMHHVNDSDNEL